MDLYKHERSAFREPETRPGRFGLVLLFDKDKSDCRKLCGVKTRPENVVSQYAHVKSKFLGRFQIIGKLLTNPLLEQ